LKTGPAPVAPADGHGRCDVLQFLAGLEADGAPGRDAYFLAGSRIPADAALARLHLEDAKASQLNAFATLHRMPHRFEDSVNRQLGLDFRRPASRLR
jgi:hypothetical protein